MMLTAYVQSVLRQPQLQSGKIQCVAVRIKIMRILRSSNERCD